MATAAGGAYQCNGKGDEGAHVRHGEKGGVGVHRKGQDQQCKLQQRCNCQWPHARGRKDAALMEGRMAGRRGVQKGECVENSGDEEEYQRKHWI